jgi:transcriptional regulator with XRE-family HTH domain
MILTLQDHMQGLGQRIKARRLALDLTQQAASAKAGVAHRTWRRMEGEDLVRAAFALRCDEGVAGLFPELAANSMDELLAQQRKPTKSPRQRAGGRKP